MQPFSQSFTWSLGHKMRPLSHSYSHSLTYGLLPSAYQPLLGAIVALGLSRPSLHWGPAYLSLLWWDLSLLVSSSRVRVIPSDKVSSPLKLPVSSHLHQCISTCLSILMAYGSRGATPNERKLATVLIGLKRTAGGESFLQKCHGRSGCLRRHACHKNDDLSERGGYRGGGSPMQRRSLGMRHSH